MKPVRRFSHAGLFVAILMLLNAAGMFLVPTSPARSAPKPGVSRSSVDRPDNLKKWQIQAVYFVPKGTPDRHLDTNGTLDKAARRMQSWFRKVSGGYTWRLDTFGRKGTLDVLFVRGRKSNAAYTSGGNTVYSTVGDELRSRGMEVVETKKRYLVFYAGDTSDDGLCGVAQYPIYGPRQYTPARDPGVKLGGDFAFVFLGADPGCHPDDFGRGTKPGWVQTSMMHELIHTEGLAPPGAPHTCDPTFLIGAGHVCGFAAASLAAPTVTEATDPERSDVMFPFVNMALSDKQLDGDNDDYFETSAGTLDLRDSAFVNPPGGRRSGGFSTRTIISPTSVEFHGDRADVAWPVHSQHNH